MLRNLQQRTPVPIHLGISAVFKNASNTGINCCYCDSIVLTAETMPGMEKAGCKIRQLRV